MMAQALKGFRDHLPAAMAPRAAMIRSIEATFLRHGFAPLQTPALEYAATLVGKYGAEGDRLLYRFVDHGGREVALRYDLTVPLARVVAEHAGAIALPFRRFQVAPVWRADKPQRGRFREFVQCDADICGVDSAIADSEVMCAGLAALADLGVKGARLHLNHRDVLFGLLRAHGVDQPDRQIACIRAIDKLDKLAPAAVAAEVAAGGALAEDAASRLVDAFAGATLDRIAALDAGGPLGHAVGRLREVIALCAAAGFGDQVVFDGAIARGLDYYTGVIYETRLTDPRVSGLGAVMSGGRYDGLIGMFAGRAIPAVGISVGLDRLFTALQELGNVGGDGGAVPVYVAVIDPAAAVEVAALLRRAGVRCELDLAAGKLGKQFERAAKRGARAVVVVGPDEIAVGVAIVKDLRRGVQTAVARADLAAALEALVGDGAVGG